jgi:uncharacterized membrane protein
VSFDFSANLARDMTTSIAWGLFALTLLAAGIRGKIQGARWTGLSLLVITIAKTFLHDLWQLGGLYRIGSLVGLAAVLFLVSYLYQRFRRPGPAPA